MSKQRVHNQNHHVYQEVSAPIYLKVPGVNGLGKKVIEFPWRARWLRH